MKRKAFYLVVALVLGIGLISIGTADAAKTIVLKHASYWPASNPHEIMMKWWCDEIEKRTNGRVKIEHYLSQSLLKVHDLLSGTSSGIADLSCIPPGYIPSNVPLATVWDMPFFHKSPWVQLKVMHDLFHTYPPVQEEWANDGVRALFCGPCSGGGIFTKEKQIKSLEDLKGVKLRTYGYVSKAINRLGGVSVSLPVPEMYTAIQRGTVDGAMFWAGPSKTFKLHEIIKYVTFNTGLEGACSAYAFMNLKVWNNLPSFVKEVIEQLDNEWVDAATKIWVKPEKEGITFMRQKGVEIYALPDEERARWTQKVNPDDLHAEWVKNVETKYGLPAGEYLTKVKALIKTYEPLDITYQMPGTY